MTQNQTNTIFRCGFTIVELIVTALIVSILSVSVGIFVVKLLTLQERDREEAYIKERLVDMSANFADYMSLGTNIQYYTSGSTPEFMVSYRHETGGVSLETNRVYRVASMTVRVNPSIDLKDPTTVDLKIATFEDGAVNAEKFSRNFRGDDTPLIPLKDIKELKLKNGGRVDVGYHLSQLNSEASLWNLMLVANYEVEDDDNPQRIVTVERIVRLWNRD